MDRAIASVIAKLEAENNALVTTNEESQEIIAELSMALAIGCEEGLVPCVEPCRGHLGPKATKVYREAYAIWAKVEEELKLLRAWESAMLRWFDNDGGYVSVRLNSAEEDAKIAEEEAWAALRAFRERNKQEEEG